MNGVNGVVQYLHTMIRVSDPDATVAFFIVDSAAIELHYSDSRESNAEVKNRFYDETERWGQWCRPSFSIPFGAPKTQGVNGMSGLFHPPKIDDTCS